MSSNRNVSFEGPKQEKLKSLKTVDLIQVGISGTFAIGVFIVAGFVLKNVAGPSIVLSVTFAMVLAVFAGIFYIQTVFAIIKMYELDVKTHTNSVLPTTSTSSKLLMPSYVLSYLYIGEWAGFAIAWNLLLEYAIGISIVSKCLSSYFESLMLGNNSLQPESWDPNDYFSFSSFFIPILAGGEQFNERESVSLIFEPSRSLVVAPASVYPSHSRVGHTRSYCGGNIIRCWNPER